MKAEKRNGKWRVRVYDYTDENGVKHNRSFTADTKAEALYLAADFKANKKGKPRMGMTVGDAIDKYIALKPMLSPTTLTAYERMRKFGFQDVIHTPVEKLDDLVMQEAINREAMRISEKTGKVISTKTLVNEWGLLASALRYVCKKTFIVTLPKKQKHHKRYPEPKEVLDAIVGTDIELPCLLSIWLTFRMSEIRGLRCSDYDGRFIRVDRVIVDTNHGSVIKDNAKTEASLRYREVKPYLRELIENTDAYRHYLKTGKDGFIIQTDRDRIYRHWKAICREHNWDLTFHDLRHLSASIMVFVGVPQRYSMDFGGWETPDVMQGNYQHILADERAYYEGVIGEWFAENLPKKSAQEI